MATDGTYIQSIPKYDIHSLDQTVTRFYKDPASLNRMSLVDRITHWSARFMGKPYLIGALGEGVEGHFDQGPLYRFDAFDCLTYVNTVIALSLSNSLTEFKHTMIRLNYRDADPRYINRHHFVSADWNIDNARAGIIQDITDQILGLHNQALVKTAETLIDRPNWLQHRQFSDIKLIKPVKKQDAASLLKELHALSHDVDHASVSIQYIPIGSMFNVLDAPITEIFDQIPHGAVIEIIRPNWDLTDKIGTHMHVSHIGFTIRQDDELFYRQASSIEKRVADVPLVDYLYRRINSPTIKGINVQTVL